MYILSIFLFYSCTKNSIETGNNFKGIVIDYVSGEKMANVPVTLTFYSVPRVGTISSYFTSGYTDANGIYNLNLENNPVRELYSIDSYKPGYSQIGIRCESELSRAIKSLNSNSTSFFDSIFIDRSSYLNILLNNNLPANTNDTIDVKIQKGKWCPFSNWISLGQYSYKENQFKGIISNQLLSDTLTLKGQPLVDVIWVVKNNGIISKDTQRIFMNEYGVTNFSINY